MRNTTHLSGVVSFGLLGLLLSSASSGIAAERGAFSARAAISATPVPGPAAPRGDFNLDGTPDILWKHASRGLLEVWIMGDNFKPHHTEQISPQTGDPLLYVAGTADFNHDGMSDIVFWHGETGAITLWYMRGTEVIRKVELAERVPDRLPVAVYDVDFDGNPDILWQSKSGELLATLIRNEMVFTKLQINVVSTGPADLWFVKGSGDVDGDGDHDLIVERSSQFGPPSPGTDQGTVIGIVRMDKTNGTIEPVAIQGDLNWKIGSVADYDRDGDTDILWENDTTGATAAWVMSGSKVQEMVVVTGPNTAKPLFEMVGPR